MAQPLTVKPGTKIRLKDFDPHDDGGLDKSAAIDETELHVGAIDDFSYRLYAENRRALLLVLQGMDTSGKDGTIRHVMRGINPQDCIVASFKQPTALELDHDFLWRVHMQVPRRGNVGIFNRSHYEDVVVVRVHKLVAKSEWQARYDHINAFEKLLSDSGTRIIKVFLHISYKEQRERLTARLEDPAKCWKFSPQDVKERELWDDYQAAYEDALTHCNTADAPWYIVPADRKWYRNLIVSRLIAEALKEMDPQFPPPAEGLDKIVIP